MESESLTLIKRRFHFHVGMHVMCPWSFASLTSFNCFFKPIRIFWSNFYQLHVLMLTLPTHDIMIFGEMNGKLASENFFWKWTSRGRRKWWNDCSKLSLDIMIFGGMNGKLASGNFFWKWISRGRRKWRNDCFKLRYRDWIKRLSFQMEYGNRFDCLNVSLLK